MAGQERYLYMRYLKSIVCQNDAVISSLSRVAPVLAIEVTIQIALLIFARNDTYVTTTSATQGLANPHRPRHACFLLLFSTARKIFDDKYHYIHLQQDRRHYEMLSAISLGRQLIQIMVFAVYADENHRHRLGAGFIIPSATYQHSRE